MNNLSFLLQGNPGGDLLMWIIPFALVIGMFWWTSRSQKKKDQEAQNMRDSLQVGDEVTTIGGIIGKVVSIKEETFVLETTKEKTHIRFLKGAIRSVDVKIADVTAAALETKESEAQTEEKAEAEAPVKKSLFGKKK
jgi:preprotein translocase subunit YajC